MVGDSITRGFALYEFEPDPSNPLYDFHSPWRTLTVLFEDSGLDGAWDVAWYQSWINGTVSPPVATTVLASDVIPALAAGDGVVFEDAGPNGLDPDAYETILGNAVDAVLAAGAAWVLVLTTPDYPGGSATSEDSQFDLVVGGRTTNDAIRAVKMARYDDARVILKEWARITDEIRAGLLSADGISEFPDGVHPAVWCGLVLVRLILEAAGIDVRSLDLGGLQDTAAANYASLAYGSGTLTAGRARQLVLLMFGVEPVAMDEHVPGTLLAEIGAIEDAPGVLYGALTTVSPEYSVVLGDVPLLLVRGGYKRAAQRTTAPKLATGGLSNAHLLNDEVVLVDGWQGGEGTLKFQENNPTRYLSGSGIDIYSEPGAVGLGPHMALLQTTAIDEIRCFEVYGGKLWVGMSNGTVYSLTTGGTWTLERTTGKTTGGITCMVHFADKLVVANGQDGVIEAYDGSSWTTLLTVSDSFMGGLTSIVGVHAMEVHFLGGLQILFVAASGSSGFSGIGPVVDNGMGGLKVDDISAGVAEPYVYVLKAVEDQLLAVGSDPTNLKSRLYRIDADTSSDPDMSFVAQIEGDYILSGDVLDGVLWLGGALNGNLYAYDGDRVELRRSLGSPANPYGTPIRGLRAFQGGIWASIHDEDGSIGLLRDNGSNDWSRPVTGLAGTTPGPLGVFNNRLHLGTNATGAARLYATNGTYRASGQVVNALMDGGFGATPKLWTGIKVTHSELLSGQSVQIEYDLDNRDDWTVLGTSATVGETSVELVLPKGTRSRQFSVRTTLTGSSGSSSTLKVYDVAVFYKPAPGVKRVWDLTVGLQGQALPEPAGHKMTLLDGTKEARTGEEIAAQVEALVDEDEQVLFLDRDRQRQVPVNILEWSIEDMTTMPQRGNGGAAGSINPNEIGWDLVGQLKLEEA